MRLKKARIVVESFEEVRKRWGRALRGELKSKGQSDVISVASWIDFPLAA